MSRVVCKGCGVSFPEGQLMDVVYKSAYDALSARLAAVEKERDEAVELLKLYYDYCADHNSPDECDQTTAALLARLADAARPEQEK